MYVYCHEVKHKHKTQTIYIYTYYEMIASTIFKRQASGFATHSVKTNKAYLSYLTMGFTIPFVVSYYSTYSSAQDELKGRSNPRLYFGRFL
ncbi:uncharacterized protein KLLA0_E23211g [Kluyveromyces lactis]|uniref:KLLA0E23211p n=1 Tax=Kluyveromyces lactis (strain ATCC 8585 / CBS 2359 / DSM 70799 / NBRC 1267 / NRRL Y-1140 / WM37) TaxID=284590 RepID=B4UN81_KLULA|nr:uncharacterized protein KLLA0_E23211g [Kluyveromyces lactis]CAR56752.1 KLLA0E23211p [Kluyveromyces lactis]|eukprot:XP_002999414.1 uncharacterized protein KLLA0_E23211g [Kluyveromyces lactis]